MDKMKIFISWSGSRSRAVAELLREYLPDINNAFDPWMSSVDIDKGSRSTAAIADALAAARAGIICLTPSNLTEPWLLYEAGGIAKSVAKPLACTLLIDLEPSDVSPPLGDFQHTMRLTAKELLQLMKTLNKAAGEGAREDANIEKSFTRCWGELKEKLDNIPADGPTNRHRRPSEEVLEDLVSTVRTTSPQDSVFLKEAFEGISERLALVERRLALPSPSYATTWSPLSGSGFSTVGEALFPDVGKRFPSPPRAQSATLTAMPIPTPQGDSTALGSRSQAQLPRKFAHASHKKRTPRS